MIEVADTSLAGDQHDKGRIYANANIPNYWIVNLLDRRIEVSSRPCGGEAANQFFQVGEAIPVILDGRSMATIPVAELPS